MASLVAEKAETRLGDVEFMDKQSWDRRFVLGGCAKDGCRRAWKWMRWIGLPALDGTEGRVWQEEGVILRCSSVDAGLTGCESERERVNAMDRERESQSERAKVESSVFFRLSPVLIPSSLSIESPLEAAWIDPGEPSVDVSFLSILIILFFFFFPSFLS